MMLKETFMFDWVLLPTKAYVTNLAKVAPRPIDATAARPRAA